MPVDLKEKFADAVNRHFSKITPLLDAELQALLHKTYPGAVRFYLFEYDSPHFSEDFTVSMWAMSAEGTPIGEGHWLLKGKAVAVPTEIYEDEKYEEIEPWGTASELLEQWFEDRVAQVTDGIKLPLFIGHHDSYFKTNLRTGKQMNWDEIKEASLG